MPFVPPCALATLWSSVRFSPEPQFAETCSSLARAFAFRRGPIRPTVQFALFDMLTEN